ncbi:MAG: hypothetical protein GF307_05955 [candidate division Zixibacteria bacterium]|nr:hypothetical protein [candidate division Zixibacteria bacterium]
MKNGNNLPQICKNTKFIDDNQGLLNEVFSIAHDMKAPIISIRGYLNRLEKQLNDNETGSENNENNIEFIKKSTARLSELVNALFKITRIEEDAKTQSIINIKELIGEIIVEQRNSSAGAKATFIVDPALPDFFCNEIKAYQIFSNLIGNAVKFSSQKHKPCITIGFKNNEYYIKDNGSGIAPEHREKVFELFFRANEQNSDGNGIGLTTVKEALDSIGGKIRLNSTPGKGTTFYINIPSVLQSKSPGNKLNNSFRESGQASMRFKFNKKANTIPPETADSSTDADVTSATM